MKIGDMDAHFCRNSAACTATFSLGGDLHYRVENGGDGVWFEALVLRREWDV